MKDKVVITFTLVGFLMGILASIIFLGGNQPAVVSVAVPTVVYQDDQIAEATNNYVLTIQQLQDGVNATMIADAVSEQIGLLNLALRKDIATAIAQNESMLYNRVLHELEVVISPTAIPYVGGTTIVTDATPVPCDITMGC